MLGKKIYAKITGKTKKEKIVKIWDVSLNFLNFIS